MDGDGHIPTGKQKGVTDSFKGLSRDDFSCAAHMLARAGFRPEHFDNELTVIDPTSPHFGKVVTLVGADMFDRTRIAVTVEGNLDNEGQKQVYFLPKNQFQLSPIGGPK